MNIIRLSSLRRDHPEIEAQAQAWVIRLDGEDLSDGEKAELGEWLSRSPVHKQLFQETARFWCDLDGLADLMFEAEQTHQRVPAQASRRTFGGFSAAAMLALLTLSGVLGWRFLPEPAPEPALEYITALGEVRDVELPDGSRMTLNTDTRLAVFYGERGRLVRLARGEAFFDVARDPDRPFVVHVGRHAVRAVGTAFDVLTREDGVDVRVLEGRIEVSRYEAPLAEDASVEEAVTRSASARMPLDRGQRAIFDNSAFGRGPRLVRASEAGLERELSWRQGMLIFENDSLATVVAEINRYTSTRLEIADPGLGQLRFGGHFRVGDISAILATLEQDFRIQVDRVSPDLVTLSRAL